MKPAIVPVLRHHAQKHAQNIYGRIVSRNADGSYQVKRIDTAENVRATRSIDGQEFVSGDSVILSRDNAVNRHVGYVIIGRPGLALQNTKTNPDTEDEFSNPGQAVISFNSVTVQQAATSDTITIRGVGFTALPTADGITISGTVTATLIACTATPDLDTAVGRYDLTLGTETLRSAVTVTATSLQLYAAGGFGGAAGRRLFKLDRSAGTSLATAITTADIPAKLCDGGDDLFARIASGNEILRIDKSDFTASAISYTGTGQNSESQPFAFDGTYLWVWGSVNTDLNQIDLDGNTIQTVSSSGGAFGRAIYAFGYLWVIENGVGLVRVDTSDGSKTTIADTSIGSSDLITNDESYIYVADYDDVAASTRIRRIDPTGMTIEETGDPSLDHFRGLAAAGGNVYVSSETGNLVHRLDRDDLTTVAATSSAVSDDPGIEGLTAVGSLVWVSVSDTLNVAVNLHRLNASTLVAEVSLNETNFNNWMPGELLLA